MAKPTVYIETTVVSYLAARPSSDAIVAAHQATTRRWWEIKATDFDFSHRSWSHVKRLKEMLKRQRRDWSF